MEAALRHLGSLAVAPYMLEKKQKTNQVASLTDYYGKREETDADTAEVFRFLLFFYNKTLVLGFVHPPCSWICFDFSFSATAGSLTWCNDLPPP